MECIRLTVWGRKNILGVKNTGKVMMAVMELSGQVLVYDEENYSNILEEEIAIAQKEATVEVFMKLSSDVENLFQKNY